jgi:hypothetical protein
MNMGILYNRPPLKLRKLVGFNGFHHKLKLFLLPEMCNSPFYLNLQKKIYGIFFFLKSHTVTASLHRVPVEHIFTILIILPFILVKIVFRDVTL